MPINEFTQTSAPVFYPSEDYSTVKYLDITKFLSLLQRQSLFFCRVDKLEDKFEGTTAKKNFEARVRWYQYMRDVEHFWTVPFPDDEIIKKVNERFEFDKKMRTLSCVNCWNIKEHESAALWKIYSDFSKGIMIKSSIRKFEKAFALTPEKLDLSVIKYLDYDKDIMPDGNSIYPLIHKQTAYSYEDEVRLIHEVSNVGWEHDWGKEEIEEGVYIKANIDTLIDEVVISPYSSNWFYKMVEDLMNKYDLKKPIKKSKLTYNEGEEGTRNIKIKSNLEKNDLISN